MELEVRTAGSIPLYIPFEDWLHGDEKYWFHALVAVDADQSERLWAIRSKPRAIAAFLYREGNAYFRQRLAETLGEQPDDFEELRSRMTQALPALAATVASLSGRDLPVIAWARACQRLARWESLSGHEIKVPEVLLQVERRALAEATLALAMPELAGYGAKFDTKEGLVQEAANLCVARPVRNLGLGEEVEGLSKKVRRMFSVPSRRRLNGHYRISLMGRDELSAWFDALVAGTSVPEEQSVIEPMRERVLASDGQVFFHALTRWRDFDMATYRDADCEGAYQLCL